MRDVIDEVLFKHEAPVADGVEQRLLERASVDAEPVLEEHDSVQRVHLAVQLLVRVDLRATTDYDIELWFSSNARGVSSCGFWAGLRPPLGSSEAERSVISEG